MKSRYYIYIPIFIVTLVMFFFVIRSSNKVNDNLTFSTKWDYTQTFSFDFEELESISFIQTAREKYSGTYAALVDSNTVFGPTFNVLGYEKLDKLVKVDVSAMLYYPYPLHECNMIFSLDTFGDALVFMGDDLGKENTPGEWHNVTFSFLFDRNKVSLKRLSTLDLRIYPLNYGQLFYVDDMIVTFYLRD